EGATDGANPLHPETKAMPGWGPAPAGRKTRYPPSELCAPPGGASRNRNPSPPKRASTTREALRSRGMAGFKLSPRDDRLLAIRHRLLLAVPCDDLDLVPVRAGRRTWPKVPRARTFLDHGPARRDRLRPVVVGWHVEVCHPDLIARHALGDVRQPDLRRHPLTLVLL